MSYVLPPCAPLTCRGCDHNLRGQCFTEEPCCRLCVWWHEPAEPQKRKTLLRAYKDCAERLAAAYGRTV